jgi:hypothetical protein
VGVTLTRVPRIPDAALRTEVPRPERRLRAAVAGPSNLVIATRLTVRPGGNLPAVFDVRVRFAQILTAPARFLRRRTARRS